MKRSIVETALGAVVIIGAGVFLAFSYKTANISAGAGGYEITANFSGIGGLMPGDDVQISGVKVGTVSAVDLDQTTFLARVHMQVDSALKLPVDTAALISSESLMGGKYLALEPGADEEILPAGGVIQFTQAPQNLEQLLGQFIFSMQKDDKKGDGEKQGAAEQPETVEPQVGAESGPASPPVSGPMPEDKPAASSPFQFQSEIRPQRDEHDDGMDTSAGSSL